MTSKPNYASDATSLGESNERLEEDGYTGQFGVADHGIVKCFTCRQDSWAGDLSVDALRRVEGASDPDDMIAVAAITCPHCSAKGTLVLKYGPESTMEEAEVTRLLEDRRSSPSGGTSTEG